MAASALPEELAAGQEGESDAEAYARIARGLKRIPGWTRKMRALGNAVVVQVPMIVGACVQQYERCHTPGTFAGTSGPVGGGQENLVPVQVVTTHQSARHLSPPDAKFENLGIERTRKIYTELNSALEGLAGRVVHTLEEIAPYLARMQSLLSQRGADRKMVLKKAGLPAWTEWAEKYARSLHYSLRTIQRRIVVVREGQRRIEAGPAAAEKSPAGGAAQKRVRLSIRQQEGLARAVVAANGLAAALRQGADWHAALAEFEKAAIGTEALRVDPGDPGPGPDWKALLANLVEALEPCEESLPAVATAALHAAQVLMGGKAIADGGRGPEGAALAGGLPEGLLAY